MHKKDYEAVAMAIHTCYCKMQDGKSLKLFLECVASLVKVLEKENPAFDKQKFGEAVVYGIKREKKWRHK